MHARDEPNHITAFCRFPERYTHFRLMSVHHATSNHFSSPSVLYFASSATATCAPITRHSPARCTRGSSTSKVGQKGCRRTATDALRKTDGNHDISKASDAIEPRGDPGQHQVLGETVIVASILKAHASSLTTTRIYLFCTRSSHQALPTHYPTENTHMP